MYTIYLEPKWPLFWLEKSLFWGLTFKNRGHIEKYDYMHICIPWSLGMLMGQTNQATTDSWPILHHWGNKESECQLGNCFFADITTSCKSCIFNAFQPSSIHANSSMPALFQHQLIASPRPPSTTGLHWKPISGNSVKATSWTIIRYFLISQISHLLTRNSSNVQKNLCRLPDPPVIRQRMKNLGLWPLPLPLLRPRPININIGRVALARVFCHSREPRKKHKKEVT